MSGCDYLKYMYH